MFEVFMFACGPWTLPYLVHGDYLLSLDTQCRLFFVTIFPVKGSPCSYFLTFHKIFCWGEGSDGWRYGLMPRIFLVPKALLVWSKILLYSKSLLKTNL